MSQLGAFASRRAVPLASWSIVAILTIVGGPSLMRAAPELGRRIAAAQPHAFDVALLAAQPLALRIHIVAVVLAIPLGAAMMLSRKGARFHRVAGWTWAGLIVIAAVTPVLLALDGGQWKPIHLTSAFVLILLVSGLVAARRHAVPGHRRRMRILYFGSLLGAGTFALLPGRLLWRLVFG